MLTYKAMYKFLDEGVHGEVLDFPGTITFGDNLPKARRLLASALVDMAETIAFPDWVQYKNSKKPSRFSKP